MRSADVKNMSFFLTTPQVRRREKTVTRRLGWWTAKAGLVVQPVVKGQGLKKGEHPEPIDGPITFVDVRRERLRRMTDEPEYGKVECIKEGFPEMSPAEFVTMFCRHNGCNPNTEIARIEFEYAKAPR